MSENQTAAQLSNVAEPLTDTEKFVFRFKKDKLGNKRSNLELEVPVPNFAGLVKILESGGKGTELVLEAVADVIRGQVANWVAETSPDDASQAKFPLEKFSWEAIANQDKKDRRTVSIDDETWAAFAGDWMDVMKRVRPSLTEENCKAQIQVLLAKFAMFKNNKKVLEQMKSALTLYIENTDKGEEFGDVLELLTRRLENYLAADDTAALAAALG